MKDVDITLKWQNGVHFIAEDGENHLINIDGSSEIGGENKGTRPMMMVLMGLASCASIDVVMILNKSKQLFRDFSVNVHAERREEIPKIFSNIHLQFIIHGEVEPKRLDHALKLSVEKYCSVAEMLNKSAKITYSGEIHK